MGVEKNKKQETRAARKARGTVNNKRRLEAFDRVTPEGSADWGGCDPQRLQDVIVGITSLGGAVTIGMSRDMGAHSMTLMLDGERTPLWFNGDADLDEELDAVTKKLGAI